MYTSVSMFIKFIRKPLHISSNSCILFFFFYDCHVIHRIYSIYLYPSDNIYQKMCLLPLKKSVSKSQRKKSVISVKLPEIYFHSKRDRQ